MKALGRISLSLLPVLAAFALSACNNDSVVGNPATPTPTDTPPAPEAPVADIESGSPIYSTLDTATFDGGYSYDPDGYITTYAWQLVSAPTGSSAALITDPSMPDNSLQQLFLDLAGNYSVKLTVTDDSGLTDTTQYDFSAAPSALHVQLSWPNQYTQADMDLHLIDLTDATPSPSLWDMQWDCHYRNCKPSQGGFIDWGANASNVDDPRLDIDNIDTNVPENMNIDTPHDGTFRMAAHYYMSHAGTGTDIPVDLTVKVWVAGTMVYSTSQTLTAQNQVWTIGDILWTNTSATISPIGTVGTTAPPSFFNATGNKPTSNYSN